MDRADLIAALEKAEGPSRVYRESAVHAMFGLSYAAYFCVPRSVLEAMPHEWQDAFVALVEQLPRTPTYSCQRRESGRFVKDPLANYRRPGPEVAALLAMD